MYCKVFIMKHDESTDVRLLSKVAKINPATKTIVLPTNAIIGNKRWGRIDFLCHYCGYHLAKVSGEIMNNVTSADKERKRKEKQQKREEKAAKRNKAARR